MPSDKQIEAVADVLVASFSERGFCREDMQEIARAALEAAERVAWCDAAEAPWDVEFHVERGGDLIRVERYDCPWPDVVKPTVINNRTGRWGTFDRWRPLPEPPQ